MKISHSFKQGTIRIHKAFGYSMAGLKSAFLAEAAFRQEVMLALIVLPILFFVHLSYVAKALIFISLMFVLITELLNSSIEAVVDRISMELHPLSKHAKDIGSAAVFLSLVNFIVMCIIAFMI